MHEDPTFHTFMDAYEDSMKTTGSRFEERMVSLIKNFAASENRQRARSGNMEPVIVMPRVEEEDWMNGTDIMLRDRSGFLGHNGTIRFDVTHKFSRKDNMPFIKSDKDEPLVIEGLDGHDYEFKYGIRMGNSHRNFEEPVIVIGFDMPSKEYVRFEDDMKAQRNLAGNIYEIVNMSNDLLQSFYYQADEDFRRKADASLEDDERPDLGLLEVNKSYVAEAGRYASRKWKLPPDTELSYMSRELLRDFVYSPAIERLSQKYEQQNLEKAVSEIPGPAKTGQEM